MREDLAEALQGCDPFLAEVIEYALFGGGKRIRPLLAILSARLCGSDRQDLYTLAAAFEYLHVATLVHDDVIDNAGERRGRDSVAKGTATPQPSWPVTGCMPAPCTLSAVMPGRRVWRCSAVPPPAWWTGSSCSFATSLTVQHRAKRLFCGYSPQDSSADCLHL